MVLGGSSSGVVKQEKSLRWLKNSKKRMIWTLSRLNGIMKAYFTKMQSGTVMRCGLQQSSGLFSCDKCLVMSMCWVDKQEPDTDRSDRVRER